MLPAHFCLYYYVDERKVGAKLWKLTQYAMFAQKKILRGNQNKILLEQCIGQLSHQLRPSHRVQFKICILSINSQQGLKAITIKKFL